MKPRPPDPSPAAGPARLRFWQGPRFRRAATWIFRVGRQTWRRWSIDRCSQEASSLAFKTALGLVPLCAVAFLLLRAASKLDERSAFIEFFANNLFPAVDARATVSATLLSFTDNVASDAVGPVGLALLIIVVFSLFLAIEAFWNRVWSAARRRSLFSKFFLFYTLVTLVPFLAAISLYHTARFWRSGVLSYFAPLASTFVALLLANKLLPVVRVRWQHAAVGAGVSALLLELAKWGFARYAAIAVGNYRTIYGALGLLPLLLLWIWVAWLAVLLGAEVAHAGQRLLSLEAGDRRRHHPDASWEAISGPTAARLLLEVARRYSEGEGAPTLQDLVERLGLPEEVVARILARLRERSLVIDTGGEATGWLPARPPGQIHLNDVLVAFRVADPEKDSDALGKLLGELEAHERERGQVSLADLLPPPRVSRRAPAADDGEAPGA